MAEAGQGIGHLLRLKYNDALSVSHQLSICVGMAWRLANTMDLEKGQLQKKEERGELLSDMSFCSNTFFEITSQIPNILEIPL